MCGKILLYVGKYSYMWDNIVVGRILHTMQNKLSNCFVWVSLSTSDLKFHFLK